MYQPRRALAQMRIINYTGWPKK